MDSTTENVFRFVQLRPPFPPETDTVLTLASSGLARSLAQAGRAERTRLAGEFLDRAGEIDKYLASDQAARLLTAQRAAVADDRTADDLRTAALQALDGGGDGELGRMRADLSDAMLANKFAAGRRHHSRDVAALFRLTSLLTEADRPALRQVKARDYLCRPIALPDGFQSRPAATTRAAVPTPAAPATATRAAGPTAAKPGAEALAGPPQPAAPAPGHAAPDRLTAAGVQRAFDEIWSMIRPESLILPVVEAPPVLLAVPAVGVHPAPEPAPAAAPRLTATPGLTTAAQPAAVRTGTTILPAGSGPGSATRTEVDFALAGPAVAGLSGTTRTVLAELDLRPDRLPVDELLRRLDAEVIRLAGVEVERPVSAGPGTGPNPDDAERPYLRDVGVADLLVVKQHLKEYQRVDLAHIENVLTGEHKSRNHREFERTEETVTTERETSQERQTELETADRFEMNRETSRTAQRDQEFGFGLTVSGKYGPTVDFSSNLQASMTTTTEETARNATRYAKDIVSRSLDRVVERVREEVVRKVVREREETNLHELTNESNEHTSGVYQFVEKVYQSQVFNYGLRQMFDFMVPEPAAYLWHLESVDTEFNLPAAPPKLESYAPNAGSVTPATYLMLAAKFGADGVAAPPANFVLAGVSLSHGADSSSEEGQPRSVAEKEVSVPDGYRPLRAMVRPQALTDNLLTLAVTVGHTQRVWTPTSAQLRPVGSDHKIGSASLNLNLLTDSYPYDAAAGKLPVQVLAFETNAYSVGVDVVFQRTDETYRAWQITTYGKLVEAYRNLVQKYDEQVEELKAQAEAVAARTTIRFGAPPSQNQRIVLGELKKHCLSIVTRQRYENFDIVQPGDPPYFDFDTAAAAGSFIRFFEQAFEWDQMQYVCYPYFWGRQALRAKRFLRQDVDQQFLEFLQAGAARVVVPVRPGFELALTHYLETGEIWNDLDEPPPVTSPLYLPIVTEIQERTGAPQAEIPIGEPWATHVPTPLVILRPQNDLPRWRQRSQGVWEWEEANT